jgi:hypothetical protein
MVAAIVISRCTMAMVRDHQKPCQFKPERLEMNPLTIGPMSEVEGKLIQGSSDLTVPCSALGAPRPITPFAAGTDHFRCSSS